MVDIFQVLIEELPVLRIETAPPLEFSVEHDQFLCAFDQVIELRICISICGPVKASQQSNYRGDNQLAGVYGSSFLTPGWLAQQNYKMLDSI